MIYYHSVALSDNFNMDERQQKLLNLVIENYIDTAEPVGSKFLVNEKKLNWSEATVRNELRALEEQGFLTHPHTSAGRIPTEKGYKFFVDTISSDKDSLKIVKKDEAVLESAMQISDDFELSRKNLAKTVAEIANASVIMAFSKSKIYYTGLSNLFHQPEFKELSLVVDISSVFDRCEECLENFYDKTDKEIKFFLGDEHPFGKFLSAVSFKFDDNGLFSLIGPMRMDYKRNYKIMSKVKNLLD